MKRLRWFGFVAVVMVAAAMAWKVSPLGDAMEAVKRLQLVWPNVATMNPSDRELLSQLASACDLPHVAATRASVVACLRDGATNRMAKVPVGISDAPAALEALIARVDDGKAK